MLGQASRYLLKLVKKTQQGKKVPFPFEYLSRAQELIKIKGKGLNQSDFNDFDFLESALAVKAIHKIMTTFAQVSASNAPDKVKDNELFGQAKLEMVTAHMKYLQVYLFRHVVEKQKFKDLNVKTVCNLMGRVHCLSELAKDSNDLFDCGFFA